jgi:hypothetical protein
LYLSADIFREIKSRRMRWAVHVACIGEGRNIQVLVENRKGKRSFVRPRHRWEDGLKINLREISCWGCGVYSLGSG